MSSIGEGQWPKLLLNLLLLCYCLGILLGHNWSETAIAGKMAIELAGGCLAGSVYLLWRQSRYTWLVLCCMLVCLGLWRYQIAMDISPEGIGHHVEHTGKVSGILEGDPRVVRDENGKLHLRYVLQADSINQGKGEEKARGKVLVYGTEQSLNLKAKGKADNNNIPALEEVGRSGDRLTVSGKIRALHGYQNPGRMDTVMTYRSQGIQAQMMAEKYSIRLEKQEADTLTRIAGDIRQKYQTQMERVMPKQDAAAIFAMLFGGYQGIKPELLESFTATGIIHILSVSGSHITLMAGTAGIVGRLCHLSDKVTAMLATATILLYSMLAGAIPPVIRSAIMGILTLLALTMGRERDAQHILGLTALGLLLFNPLLLYDISFQLSFGATAGLLYVAPVIQQRLRRYMHDFFASSLAVTLGAQLSVLPLLAWYFNTVSLSSLVANLLITPVVEWLIVLGLLAGLLGSLIPMLGSVVFVAGSVLLGLVYESAKVVANLPGSQLYLPSFSWLVIGIYYLGLGYWLYREPALDWLYEVRPKHFIFKLLMWWERRGLGQRTAIGALACAVMICCWLGRSWWQPLEMQVHFIDVGQGDAALVVTPHGRAFMVDTGGSRNQSYNIGTMVDVPYLRHYGVRQLDYIFLTHAHEDHAAGVKGIIEKMPVKAIMIGHEGNDAYLQTFGTGKAAKIEKRLIPLEANSVLELDGVRIEILYSPTATEAMQGGAATGNEFSNLIRVSYGKASFLFTGDLVAAQEAELLEKHTPLASTVLKVGHHGSHTSSTPEFLKAVNPSWAVISVGYGNSFGHPHGDILQRLGQLPQMRLLRTDQQGAIVFRTDGAAMKVETFVNK